MRKYYSVRTGKNPHTNLDLPMLSKLFLAIYNDFHERDYFTESYGYGCIDEGEIPGLLGHNIVSSITRYLRKTDLWPIHVYINDYSEDDLFDVIEFLFDNVSKPTKGFLHDYANCGMHWNEFDRNIGKQEFAAEINSILADYNYGYILSSDGEILHIPESGFEHLIDAALPDFDPVNVEQRVQSAIDKFRRSRSIISDRRDAIRDLTDVLEFLRPQAHEVLNSNDESDLFNLANNFGIRHHNINQKTNYAEAIWYSWLFYYYLATIHACIHLIKKRDLANHN